MKIIKPYVLSIRVTEEEKQDIMEKASALDMTVSKYLHKILFEEGE